MDKLEKAKEIIRENIENGKYGIFNTKNFVGDSMSTIFDEEGLTVDICHYYGYFEVFGLNKTEFAELKKYYKKLSRGAI